MELVNAVVPLIQKPLQAATTHVVYPFKVSSNVHSLESAAAELRALKSDVRTEIANAEHENRMATDMVTLWLKEVEAIEQKAEEICENYRQLGRCLFNSSPNLWANYKISRNAAKKHVEVKSLCERKAAFQVTIDKPPTLAQEIPASSSKSPILELALHSIRDDVHDTIGIWGMGGVGKTHLLKQINNELSRDGAFNVVVFVTCSKERSEEKKMEEKIQNEIIDKLRLSKNDNGEQNKTKQNDNGEQNKITIYNFLNQRNFLLLLDDLGSGVDLEMVGIPNRMVTDGTCKRKVVLTTRSEDVCAQMEAKRKLKVDPLKGDDAWSLFKEKVTEKTINSDPLIQKCAEDVVKELGGLPLALITVGRAMRDKEDHRLWEHAIEQLKNARLDKSVFQILKYSYDSLEDETLKQCFLHCSLWPEDYEIKKGDLIDLWMGLGLIDKSNIQEAYNAGHFYIGVLQARCLLEEIDENVKMHDVIRDMALWIANNQVEDKKKWIVKTGTSTKSSRIEISPETEKLSMMWVKPKVFLSATCSSSKLSTLLLQGNSLRDCKPLHLDAFSELIVLDLSSNWLKAFPVEICKLVQLQFLNMSYNGNLEALLPEELVALINLKYLLLRNTYSCTIPNGVLSKLKALRVLDLYGTRLKWVDGSSRVFTSLEGELQYLPHFQALGITIENMYNFQMLSKTSTVPVRDLEMRHLYEEDETATVPVRVRDPYLYLRHSDEEDETSTLEMSLSDEEDETATVPVRDLEIRLSDEEDETSTLEMSLSDKEDETATVPVRVRDLEIRLSDEEDETSTLEMSLSYKEDETSTVPVRVRDLEIRLSDLENNLVSLSLNSMYIEWVKFERESLEQSIGRLEKLSFRSMENMKEVLTGLDPKDVFPRLQVLYFWECPQLTSISWVARLPRIRELTVQYCKSMKQFISADELDNGGNGIMVCQKLKKMTAWTNEELESISSDPVITFPALESFEVSRCNKLRKLPFKTDNPPKQLKVAGSEEWWNNILEFDDIAHRTTLQGYFSKDDECIVM